MKVGRDAAHLYDAVMLYAWSIRKILHEDLGDPNNGSLVIDLLKGRPYFRLKHCRFGDIIRFYEHIYLLGFKDSQNMTMKSYLHS